MKKWLVCIALCLTMALLVACNDTPPAGSGNGGSQDSGSQDGGNQDGGTEDGGSQDGGNQDGGTEDGGSQDGGSQDGGSEDGGTEDGGTGDGGNQDGGSEDGGNQDGGNEDDNGEDGKVNPENEKIKGYLKALLEGFRVDPYSYLPEKMLPGAVSVNASALTQNYTGGVSVSSIPMGGYGEQWNMIIENLAQSEVFFGALSVVEGLTTTSVSIFNNYLDENPEATAAHSFKSGIYTVSINYEDGVLDYVLDYTADFPIVGTQTAQIALSLDVSAGEKTVRIQLGDANALRYVVSADSYEFAIRYLGVRRAYFSVARDGENTEGHIYEYLTVKGIEIASAADFYATEDYVTAVGNKADGIIGFKNYISELYDPKSGALLGYEVRESLSALTFDTLWFDLASIDGLTSIRYRAADADAEIEEAFFVNGNNAEWTAKKVSLLNTSRRFDIEFRDRYFYVYNTAEEKYEKHAVKVPMLFVQEDYYDSLSADVKSENGITVLSKVATSDLEMIKSEYAEKVDVFIANKENMTVDEILTFIGSKKSFE